MEGKKEKNTAVTVVKDVATISRICDQSLCSCAFIYLFSLETGFLF